MKKSIFLTLVSLLIFLWGCTSGSDPTSLVQVDENGVAILSDQEDENMESTNS